MFSSSGLMPTAVSRKSLRHRSVGQNLNKNKKRKKKSAAQELTGCVGTRLHLSERYSDSDQAYPSHYGFACSLRCRHPIHTKDRSRSFSRGKSEDWIPEEIYKQYTETDSRPLTPELTRRSGFFQRGLSVSGDGRKCATPEPETRQCQFHHRRVLILDLRRVKSVDAITRQDSRTTGTSADSTYGDDDLDNRSSSANPDSSSIMYQFSPRNISHSRSITPKTKQRKGKKKSKERSTSPIVYERSTSPKILEGKLRRHGRNRNKNPSKVKSDEMNPTDRAGSEEVKKTTTDEPNETQVSTFPNPDDEHDGMDGRLEAAAGDFDESNKQLQKFSESRRALYHVLDDHLAGKPWNPKAMANLDEEIGVLVEDFRKYQTKFKTNLIKMKEDYWLSFPRTWSRSSATFGVPYETRSLKGMTSLNYLERFVTISEPRRHLYSLIFQRHRMISNPTGKHIALKTCKQALSEVLGRPFLEEEMKQLCEDYLGCIDTDVPILETQFHGIAAFCERIYACYSLEEHHECHVCHNNPTKDKQRCHQDQKSHLETADLAYLSIKVRQGKVQPHLSSLLSALCERD